MAVEPTSKPAATSAPTVFNGNVIKKDGNQTAKEIVVFPTQKTENVDTNLYQQSMTEAKANIKKDLDLGILHKGSALFGFVKISSDEEYLFDYKEYKKQTGDDGFTLNDLKNRYNLSSKVLAKLNNWENLPGNLNTYCLEKNPTMQLVKIPKEIIPKEFVNK